MSCGAHRPGFTLIEALATLALVGLVFATVAASVSGSSEAATLREAVEMVQARDQRARVRAMRGAATASAIDGTRMILASASATTNNVVSGTDLPRGVLAWRTDLDGQELQRLVYDTAGRSESHAWALRLGEHEARWVVNGDTGWIESLDRRAGWRSGGGR